MDIMMDDLLQGWKLIKRYYIEEDKEVYEKQNLQSQNLTQGIL